MHNQKQAIKSKATNLNKIGKRASCQLLALLALTAPANAFDLKLTAPDGSERDFFGGSVALRDNLALIGAPLEDDNARNSGSAYLFDTTTGSLLQKFTAPDGSDGDIFGNSVALSDNLALIGAPGDDDKGTESGSVYLFDTTTGSLLQKFIAPDGFSAGVFGGSLTLRDNLALIGAPGDQENGILSGSAYLFDTSTGSLLQKFTAPDGSEFNFFGNSVALSDRLALIGASGDDDNGRSSGSTYLFDTTTGSLLQKLTAPDGSEGDIFGTSVALSDRLALIGAPADQDNGENSGSAYLFDITTGSLLQKFTPPDGSDGDLFGGLIALRDNLALIGAPGDQDNGENSGSAYLFTINPQPTPEPSSLLGIAGTVAIAALSRKKQQKK